MRSSCIALLGSTLALLASTVHPLLGQQPSTVAGADSVTFMPHMEQNDPRPVPRDLVLILTEADDPATSEAAAAEAASLGIEVRHYLPNGVLLGSVPRGYDLDRVRGRIFQGRVPRLTEILPSEAAGQAEARARPAARRSARVGADALRLIAEMDSRAPRRIDWSEVEGWDIGVTPDTANGTGAGNPGGGGGGGLWWWMWTPLFPVDLMAGSSYSAMVTKDRKFVFGKTAIGVRYIESAGSNAGVFLARTIAGMESFLRTNPDAAASVAYEEQFNVPEPTGKMTEATSSEWDWATGVRVRQRARWSFIVYWDDDQDGDACPANRSCSSIDYGDLGFWFAETPASLRLKMRPNRTEEVVAHEIGHIFGAPDEYDGGYGCTSNSYYDECGAQYGIWEYGNQNCARECGTLTCLMKDFGNFNEGLFSFDGATRYHWGWDDSDGDRAVRAIDPHGSDDYGLHIFNLRPGDVVKIYDESGVRVRSIPVTLRNASPYGTEGNYRMIWEGYDWHYDYLHGPGSGYTVQVLRNNALVSQTRHVFQQHFGYPQIRNLVENNGQVEFDLALKSYSTGADLDWSAYLLVRVLDSGNRELGRFVNHEFRNAGHYAFDLSVFSTAAKVLVTAWLPRGDNAYGTLLLGNPPTVSISGTSTIKTEGGYSWTALADGGDGSYTYRWEYRPDGSSTWYSVGSSASYSRYVTSSDYPGFTLRATVTSAGIDAVDEQMVAVLITSGGCRKEPCETF